MVFVSRQDLLDWASFINNPAWRQSNERRVGSSSINLLLKIVTPYLPSYTKINRLSANHHIINVLWIHLFTAKNYHYFCQRSKTEELLELLFLDFSFDLCIVNSHHRVNPNFFTNVYQPISIFGPNYPYVPTYVYLYVYLY